MKGKGSGRPVIIAGGDKLDSMIPRLHANKANSIIYMRVWGFVPRQYGTAASAASAAAYRCHRRRVDGTSNGRKPRFRLLGRRRFENVFESLSLCTCAIKIK